jgi:crossover junction endodeoxyribonuclease RusA
MITLTGNPFSTNNIYFSSPKMKPGMRIMSQKARDRKEQYGWEAKSQWHKGILQGDVEINIRLYFGDKRRRDWDNYHKLSIDALTGIVWEDDSQIQIAHVRKYYDKEKPRIEVEII